MNNQNNKHHFKRNALSINTWGILFIIPAATFFLVVNIIPMIYAFFLSFHDWNFLSSKMTYVFLENYINLLKDPLFLKSLWNTFLYTLIIVPLTLAFSLFCALLLNSGIKHVSFFRVIYFIPFITSIIAVGYIWKWLYDPTFGILNYMLAWIGLSCPFLKSTITSLPSIALMSVWKSLGFNIIIFLAGLQSIPDTVYEAARIDGANKWRTFWKITLPLLNPTVIFLTVMGIMHSLKIFSEIFAMTESGGPLHSTQSVVYRIVETSFKSYQMGYGAAMSTILFLIIITVTIIQMKILTKKFNY